MALGCVDARLQFLYNFSCGVSYPVSDLSENRAKNELKVDAAGTLFEMVRPKIRSSGSSNLWGITSLNWYRYTQLCMYPHGFLVHGATSLFLL